ncbi:MAG: hypothetical protein ACP5O2_02230 [Bacteroidales bacterium]
MRPKYPNFLLIAGNARNVGKSHLAIALIRKYSLQHRVVGLKVSAVYAGDASLHGHHDDPAPETWSLYRETWPDLPKDTSRFLQAGADSVWFLRARDEYLVEGFSRLIEEVGDDALVVCESRSLIKLIEPGVFILIEKHLNGFPVKDVSSLVPLAQLRILTGAGKYDTPQVMTYIETDGRKWWITRPAVLTYP